MYKVYCGKSATFQEKLYDLKQVISFVLIVLISKWDEIRPIFIGLYEE